MSAPDKKIILRCFFQHKVIYLCAEFQLYLTPSTGFLPIDITFFGNIGLEYFSNQFLRVFHQSKLELSDLDEKLPKSRPLLLNIFESSNCVDRRIVHCYRKWIVNEPTRASRSSRLGKQRSRAGTMRTKVKQPVRKITLEGHITWDWMNTFFANPRYSPYCQWISFAQEKRLHGLPLADRWETRSTEGPLKSSR